MAFLLLHYPLILRTHVLSASTVASIIIGAEFYLKLSMECKYFKQKTAKIWLTALKNFSKLSI